MTLLFITQKLHEQDQFVLLWIQEFVKRGYEVHVLCLENRLGVFERNFRLSSMGKERGVGKSKQVWVFWNSILTLQYDRVFIHMSPVWYALGFWVWLLRGVPVYLWYTHYKMSVGVWLFGLFGKRFFCATEQSLPQYVGSPKKVVTGHGIDLQFWPMRQNVCTDPHRLLVVHRLSRSKRVELSFRALVILPAHYTIDVYGIEAEPDYVQELRDLVDSLGLKERVTFHGTVPMGQLPTMYIQHRLLLNMASETIDKTMLEALTCGCYPVTTKGNAEAIGIPDAPLEESPEAIAHFIQSWEQELPLSSQAMYRIVEEHHSLDSLIQKMDRYILPGV